MERRVHRAGDIGFDAVEVDLPLQALGKRRGRSVAVVSGAIEAAVDGPLDPSTERLEYGIRDEGR